MIFFFWGLVELQKKNPGQKVFQEQLQFYAD